jgi:hypothetical protein
MKEGKKEGREGGREGGRKEGGRKSQILCNLSYSGGDNQEDCGSRPARTIPHLN